MYTRTPNAPTHHGVPAPRASRSSRGPSSVRRALLGWYARSGRDLPWRRTRDPYRILVSEVMLQQTQVSRVVPAYRRFLRRFPGLTALRHASVGDVLREWSGLGYNRRAAALHRIARSVRALPRSAAELDALPGVGAYTAGAVACFAHGERVAFADTNIRRVLGRLQLGRVASEREALAIDERLMPRRPNRWHDALMDIGALFCSARAPKCALCPLARFCRARGTAGESARRRQTPFGTSDRRVRGRIVATLGAARRGLKMSELTALVADPRVASLADRLIAEGMLERAGGRVRLPV